MNAKSIRATEPLEVRIHRGAGNGARPWGVIISHGHQDHWGLAPQLPTGIPVFIGEGAANILLTAQFWGSGVDLREAGHLHDRVPFTLGQRIILDQRSHGTRRGAGSCVNTATGRAREDLWLYQQWLR